MRDLSGNSGWLAGPPPKAPEAPEEEALVSAPATDEALGAPEQALQTEEVETHD